jgi:hypothetical protein
MQGISSLPLEDREQVHGCLSGCPFVPCHGLELVTKHGSQLGLLATIHTSLHILLGLWLPLVVPWAPLYHQLCPLCVQSCPFSFSYSSWRSFLVVCMFHCVILYLFRSLLKVWGFRSVTVRMLSAHLLSLVVMVSGTRSRQTYMYFSSHLFLASSYCNSYFVLAGTCHSPLLFLAGLYVANRYLLLTLMSFMKHCSCDIGSTCYPLSHYWH